MVTSDQIVRVCFVAGRRDKSSEVTVHVKTDVTPNETRTRGGSWEAEMTLTRERHFCPALSLETEQVMYKN